MTVEITKRELIQKELYVDRKLGEERFRLEDKIKEYQPRDSARCYQAVKDFFIHQKAYADKLAISTGEQDAMLIGANISAGKLLQKREANPDLLKYFGQRTVDFDTDRISIENQELKLYLGALQDYKKKISLENLTIAYLSSINKQTESLLQQQGTFPSIMVQGESKQKDKEEKSPKRIITFDDIAGYTELKETFAELCYIVTVDNVYARAGVPMPTGFILYGPAGTGKTTLVEAFANEAKLPLHELSIPETFNKYIGESEKIVSKFLRQQGVLLIDEFDSIGKSKDGESHQIYSSITNTIAVELNRYDPDRILFATTNEIGNIDKKLKSRRMENIILIDFPNQSDCAEIIDCKLRQASERSAGFVYTDVDSQIIAKSMVDHAEKFSTENKIYGFSGADIENLIHSQIRKSCRPMIKGKELIPPTTEEYLQEVFAFDFLTKQ
jgi:ATP-dependent 26S proteasome regulatory subunit